MTTLHGLHAGYYVAAPVYSLTVAADGTVTGYGLIAFHTTTEVNVYNYGSINASTTKTGVSETWASIGIYLADGGKVVNTSSIYGRVGVDFQRYNGAGGYLTNSGSIGAKQSGVIIEGGYVHNSGQVLGGVFGVDVNGNNAIIINSGQLGSVARVGYNQTAGVYIPALRTGDSVTNTAYGHILSGAVAVDCGGHASVENYGVISGKYGVELSGGGEFSNFTALYATYAAEVTATFWAAKITGAAAITNTGLLLSQRGAAVSLINGGYVENEAGGTIRGGSGVIATTTGAAATVTNYGTISGGTLPNAYGVKLQAGAVTNGDTIDGGGALIKGVCGIRIASAGAKVTNFGTVQGTGVQGIDFVNGGTVVNGSDVVRTAAISGGHNAVYIGGAAGSVTNYGSLVGDVVLMGGGVLVNGHGNDPAASIVGALAVNANAKVSIVNFGLIESTYQAKGGVTAPTGDVVNGSAVDRTALDRRRRGHTTWSAEPARYPTTAPFSAAPGRRRCRGLGCRGLQRQRGRTPRPRSRG